MKKIIIFILVMILAVMFAGCGENIIEENVITWDEASNTWE